MKESKLSFAEGFLGVDASLNKDKPQMKFDWDKAAEIIKDELKKDYRIIFIPDPVCWTEAPFDLGSLSSALSIAMTAPAENTDQSETQEIDQSTTETIS